MYIKLTKNIINELIISENVNINLINNIIKSKLNYDKFNLILETEYNYSWVNITNKILWCLIKDKNYNYHNNVKFLFIINIKNNNEIKIYKFFDNIKIRFINVNNNITIYYGYDRQSKIKFKLNITKNIKYTFNESITELIKLEKYKYQKYYKINNNKLFKTCFDYSNYALYISMYYSGRNYYIYIKYYIKYYIFYKYFYCNNNTIMLINNLILFYNKKQYFIFIFALV